MPKRLNHPSDPKHTLVLLSSPYPEGVFWCNACGKDGHGFCYHCKECNIDLHVMCSSMPKIVMHGAHPHPLDLAFSPPYPDKIFTCDVCNKNGSNHWLYMCNQCEFDAHLSCAVSKCRPQSTINRQEHSRTPSTTTTATTRRVHSDTRRPSNGGFHHSHGASTAGLASQHFGEPARVNQTSGLYGNMVQGIEEGASQQLMQSMFQSMLGGGSPSMAGNGVGLNQFSMLGGGYPFDPTNMGMMPGLGMDPSSSLFALNMMQNLGGGGLLGGFLGGGLGFF